RVPAPRRTRWQHWNRGGARPPSTASNAAACTARPWGFPYEASLPSHLRGRLLDARQEEEPALRRRARRIDRPTRAPIAIDPSPRARSRRGAGFATSSPQDIWRPWCSPCGSTLAPGHLRGGDPTHWVHTVDESRAPANRSAVLKFMKSGSELSQANHSPGGCAGVRSLRRSRGAGLREWSFLTNHAAVLLAVARHPEARLRDLADDAGITERGAHRIVSDLVDAGCITRVRVGRRNRYELRVD